MEVPPTSSPYDISEPYIDYDNYTSFFENILGLGSITAESFPTTYEHTTYGENIIPRSENDTTLIDFHNDTHTQLLLWTTTPPSSPSSMSSSSKSPSSSIVSSSLPSTISSNNITSYLANTTSQLLESTSTITTTLDTEWNSSTTMLALNDSIYANCSTNSSFCSSTSNSTFCARYLPIVSEVSDALGPVAICLWMLGLTVTFTLLVLYVKQFWFIYKTAHKSFRRHLYSFTSIYLIMSLMTTIGTGIPRAHGICSALKDIHMAIGIGHFVDLTIAMYGSENKMAKALEGSYINLRATILFKCCFCIPPFKTKRRSVTILKWMVWQMKWSQAVYYCSKLIYFKSFENSEGQIPYDVSAVWMHVLNVISFVSGIISLLLIRSLVWEDLAYFNYSTKSKIVRFTILATKLQRLLFEILEASGVFPCIPPFTSSTYYKNVCKDFIYLFEVLILGAISYKLYTKRGEFEHSSLEREVEMRPLEKTIVEPVVEVEDRNKTELNVNNHVQLVPRKDGRF